MGFVNKGLYLQEDPTNGIFVRLGEKRMGRKSATSSAVVCQLTALLKPRLGFFCSFGFTCNREMLFQSDKHKHDVKIEILAT